jgi:NADH dehydrogenase [ubiquinone] 1 alpha subcomplex assembly factor 6
VTELSFLAGEVRRYDRDRFLCALFAPADRREDLFALYAFNSAIARIRETVSEPLMGEIRLQWWRDTLDAIYGGRKPIDATARALSDVIERRDLARAGFDRLVDARQRDLDERRPADLPELVSYAEESSATLTLLTLDVLGAGNDQAVRSAGTDVGVAWALTGLLRAVPVHAAQGRVWLPSSVLADCEGVRRGRSSPELLQAVSIIATAADQRLASARKLAGSMGKAGQAALLPASLASSDLGMLARAGYDPFEAMRRGAGPGRTMGLIWNGLRGRF